LTGAIDRAELGRQARILTMPGEMGERFKVIALAKDFNVPLAGFQSFDQRSRL
jgi:SAM-dependent MidA family methyltransferase